MLGEFFHTGTYREMIERGTRGMSLRRN